MKTDVCLTFDVEFTIGGAFSDPANKQPVSERSVFCDVDGESQGLGFILNTLSKHKLTATFFVEALNFHYFGDSPMSGIDKNHSGRRTRCTTSSPSLLASFSHGKLANTVIQHSPE